MEAHMRKIIRYFFEAVLLAALLAFVALADMARAVRQRRRQHRQRRKVAVRLARGAAGGRTLKAGAEQKTGSRTAAARCANERQ